MPRVVMNDGTPSRVVMRPLATPTTAPAITSPTVTSSQGASGYEP